VLLLDEPTNDLDIPTSKFWRKAFSNFAVPLCSSRTIAFLLDRVSTIVLGFDGFGRAERFVDYSQWEAWQEEQQAAQVR